MTPSFALILDYDGISLLHREADQWRLLGTVSPVAPDLARALIRLRATAQQLAGDEPLCTILVLPQSQILYLRTQAAGTDADQNARAVTKRLDGATPYAIDELAFDWKLDGPDLRIAAVARATLAEAEDFATQYGFGPLGFTGAPKPGKFPGAPFFGQTRLAPRFLGEGGTLDLDLVPIRCPEESGAGTSAAPAGSDPDTDDAPQTGAPPREPEAVQADAAEESRAPGDDTLLPEGDGDAAPPPAPSAPAPQVTMTPGTTAEAAPSAVRAAPRPARRTPASEAEALTVFGARKPQHLTPGGGQARLAAGLAACVLICLIGLWALLGNRTADVADTATGEEPLASVAVEGVAPEEIAPPAIPPAVASEEAEPATAGLEVTEAEALADYETHGVWQRAPEPGEPPAEETPDEVYIASIDPSVPNQDAFALPDPEALSEALPVGTTTPPLTGTDAVEVTQGKPRVTPPARPASAAPVPAEGETAELAASPAKPAMRPKTRPADLVENAEIIALGGRTRDELGRLRPAGRPASVQETAAALAAAARMADAQTAEAQQGQTGEGTATPADEIDLSSATDRAVPASPQPQTRPAHIAQLADEAQKRAVAEALALAESDAAAQAEAVAAAEAAAQAEAAARAEAAALASGARAVAEQQAAQQAAEAERQRAAEAAKQAELQKQAEAEAARQAEAARRAEAEAAKQAQAARRAEAAAARRAEEAAELSDEGEEEDTGRSRGPAVARNERFKPTAESAAAIAREATVANVLPLGKVALVGVYGAPNQRSALVRLPSGKYVKLVVGDSLDGGRVAAIGTSELLYQKGSRTLTLTMPKG